MARTCHQKVCLRRCALTSAAPLLRVCTTPVLTFHYSTTTTWSWKQQPEAAPHEPLRTAGQPKALTKDEKEALVKYMRTFMDQGLGVDSSTRRVRGSILTAIAHLNVCGQFLHALSPEQQRCRRVGHGKEANATEFATAKKPLQRDSMVGLSSLFYRCTTCIVAHRVLYTTYHCCGTFWTQAALIRG